MYPNIRKAEPKDYDAIWAIWMQEHIIQWMSFTKQSQDQFKAHYEHMAKTSKIYVLVDLNKETGEEEVVGVRRIKFGKNQHDKHIAEYCSMGIRKDMQGKGYAKLFYKKFEELAREKGIKRIQLTQSGGNMAAFHLAENFAEEAVFPDWLEREGCYLIERWIYLFLDEDFAKQALQIPSLAYKEVLPPLLIANNNSITIKQEDNNYTAYFNGEKLLTLQLEPDESVIRHIGFLAVELHQSDNQSQATIALQRILTDILQKGRVKKVELFTADPDVTKLCQNAGFFVRGEKIASYYDEDKNEYKNELGVEYSFFTIEDANKLITAKIANEERRKDVASALSSCYKKIGELIKNNNCDILGARYLEYLTYQVVRDSLGPNKVFSLDDQRWKHIIEQIPSDLHNALVRLQNRLQNTSAAPFFDHKVEKAGDDLGRANSFQS